MKQAVHKFLTDESGLTTVEYAVAGALVSLAVVGAFELLGTEVSGVITDLKDAVSP